MTIVASAKAQNASGRIIARISVVIYEECPDGVKPWRIIISEWRDDGSFKDTSILRYWNCSAALSALKGLCTAFNTEPKLGALAEID